MSEFAVVVIAFNRADCLVRLLNSLNNADYCGDEVPLIISIDNSGNEVVTKIAHDFKWNNGKKIVRTFPKRQGLRRHVLSCGDLTAHYKNVIIFEDDIYASEGFYRFAKLATEFYENDERIAGIALYSHLWQMGRCRPFLPINDQYDGYFLQYPCSWGQIWSKNQWAGFMDWYKKNQGEIQYSPNIPEYIKDWPDDSWLKYHIKYCIDTNRFFFYPRISLSTNFGSKGQHNFQNNNGFQVPILKSSLKVYNLPRFEESNAKYDAFFEFLNIGNYLGLDNKIICVDLYGMKKNALNKRYWITMEMLDYQIIKSFDLSMRPHEMNIIKNIEGDIIHLYDTYNRCVYKKKKKVALQKLIVEYDIKNIPYYHVLNYLLITTIEKIQGKWSRFLKKLKIKFHIN